jgi:hypothetical protein
MKGVCFSRKVMAANRNATPQASSWGDDTEQYFPCYASVLSWGAFAEVGVSA